MRGGAQVGQPRKAQLGLMPGGQRAGELEHLRERAGRPRVLRSGRPHERPLGGHDREPGARRRQQPGERLDRGLLAPALVRRHGGLRGLRACGQLGLCQPCATACRAQARGRVHDAEQYIQMDICSGQLDDPADPVLVVHELEALVDVVEADAVREERVDVDVAVEVALDELGDLVAALDAAEATNRTPAGR